MKILIDEQDFSQKYGIPRRTIQAWRFEGRGPTYTKLGSRVWYRTSDIELWITSNTKIQHNKLPRSHKKKSRFLNEARPIGTCEAQ